MDEDNYQIITNPLKGIKKFKELHTEDRILSKQEYHLLLDASPEYFRRIILFVCNTGMRKMEILSLKFGQINFLLNGTEVELTNTKRGEKEYVPLNMEVVEMLQLIAGENGKDITKHD
jgi:integrase